jgi:hypothetical protein
MLRRSLTRLAICNFLVSMAAAMCLSAQEPSLSGAPRILQESANSIAPTPSPVQVAVPAGTRLPLMLRNGINTRSAKTSDSVYFVTVYPIAVNNRTVIPMGTFVRGEILEGKRPGRIRGRGEFRIALEQMTFSNGYLIDFRANPTSVDRDGREEITPGGRVTGPSGVGKDLGTVALATVIGGPAGGYAASLARAPFRNSVAIGHGIGFATGLAVVLFTRGPDAELPRGTTIDSILDRPLILDAASLPADAGAGVDPLSRSSPLLTEARRDRRELQGKGARRPLFFPFLFRPF